MVEGYLTSIGRRKIRVEKGRVGFLMGENGEKGYRFCFTSRKILWACRLEGCKPSGNVQEALTSLVRFFLTKDCHQAMSSVVSCLIPHGRYEEKGNHSQYILAQQNNPNKTGKLKLSSNPKKSTPYSLPPNLHQFLSKT